MEPYVEYGELQYVAISSPPKTAELGTTQKELQAGCVVPSVYYRQIIGRGCYMLGSGEEALVSQPFLLVPKRQVAIKLGENKMIKHKRGFTLIEVLVVVLVIGILSAVALPQYQRAVAKSRLAEVLLVVRHLEQQNLCKSVESQGWGYNDKAY